MDYKPTRTLRSAEENLPFVPRTKLSSTSRAFSVAAPKLWNTLPLDIRNYSTMSIFRKLLKTHYEHQSPDTSFRVCDSMVILSDVSIDILAPKK